MIGKAKIDVCGRVLLILITLCLPATLAGQDGSYDVQNTVYAGGADPTGSRDSTAAVQAAISAASNAGGGIVYFPPGNYIVANAQPASNVTLRGGADVGIWIQGSRDTLQQIDGGPFNPVSNVTIRRCNFRNLALALIKLLGITGKVTVLDTEFYNTADPGWAYNEEVIASNLPVFVFAPWLVGGFVGTAIVPTKVRSSTTKS